MEQAQTIPYTRRGLHAFAAIAAGILLADALPAIPAPVWLSAACVLLALAGVCRSRHCRPLLAAAALLLGAGSMAARVLSTPRDRLALADEAPVLVVRGTVLTPPRAEEASDTWERPRHWQGPALRLTVEVDSVQRGSQWADASGEAAIYVRSAATRAAPGDRIEATGRFRPVSGPANPGQRDARRWAAQEGRVGTLSIEDADAVTVMPSPPGPAARVRAAISSGLARVHQCAGDALSAALGPAGDESGSRSRALLKAMIIGDEDPSLRPVSDDMSRLGIVHILSISGFHLVLVAWVLVNLIRLTGDRGVWEYALAAAAIGLYLLVVPAQAPVVRSGVMVLVLLLTEATGRRYDRLNILAWTACALALWRPLDIFSPGFQLSFGVTAALIWRAGAWSRGLASSGLLSMPGVKGRTRREPVGLVQSAANHTVWLVTATAIAWTVSSAVVAYHVGVLSLSGVVAGIVLTVPSICAIAAGFVAMVVAVVSPAAAGPIGDVALFFADVTAQGSRLAAGFPASALTLPQVPLAWTIATTAVAIAAISPGGWRRTGTRLAALGCVLWLAGTLVAAGLPVRRGTIDRYALPNSSATLIRAADQCVLIDPGSGAKRSGAFTLRRALAASGAWRTRTVIITGLQTERFDHLPDLARTLGVQTVLLPPGFVRVAAARPGGDQERLLTRLRELGVDVRTLEPTEALLIGDLSIGVDGPGEVHLGRPGTPPERLSLAPLETAEHREIPN